MYWGWLTKFCFLYHLQDSVSFWRVWQLFPCGKDPKYKHPNCFLWPNHQWRPYQQLSPYVELCFSLSFYNLHVSEQNQLPKKPLQPCMLCWRVVVGLLLFFLINVLASLCFIRPSWGPDQDQASSHDILSAHIFAAGISTEKSVGMCLEEDISSCFPSRLCIYTESSLFFPLSSLRKREKIHTVFGFLFVVALLI